MEENIEVPKNSLLVSNSGLAIISVFLPRFFEELEMLTNGEFINNEAARRATLLTQYVISGEFVFRENELIMNKVICGVEIENPVPESIEVTSEETELAESLLHAVISHWKTLGSTSIAGLRETFLIRSGRIFETDQSWNLEVETKGFDVLLDSIPWSFGLIYLPWMKKPIKVNWR